MSEPVLLTHRHMSLDPPPLPARNRPSIPTIPPLPARRRPSNQQSTPTADVTSDFEQRFQFHDKNTLPPPEPLSECKKTYASQHPRNKPKQRPPPPPPPLPPRSR